MTAVRLMSCTRQVACCTDLAARRGWSDEDNDDLTLPLAAAGSHQGPKEKAPKAKAKRKPQTKK